MTDTNASQAASPSAAPDAPRPAPAGSAAPPPADRRRGGGIRAFLNQVRAMGRDAASVALGRLLAPPAESQQAAPNHERQADRAARSSWRVNMLHAAAERLRGAADSYIAAKLDEIEARVDAKLDQLEARLDAKVVELHRQLREMRDRELRHRLRLLKITLIFTVLVALLSLLYKWLVRHWIG